MVRAMPSRSGDAGLPAKHLPRPGDVGTADFGIIGRQWLDGQRGLRSGDVENRLGELPYRILVRVADVHRIGISAHEQLKDPLDLVVHVAEAAGLAPVAIQRQRLARQRLDDEVRHDTPVMGAHSGTVRVEDPHDPGIDTVKAMVGHRQRFGESLRLVVHASRPDRIDVSPVALNLRMDERIAVHLGGGRKEEPRALRLGDAQRIERAQRAHLERLDRQLEIIDRARGRGEVQHAVEIAGDVRELGDVVAHEREALVPGEVRDVVWAPSDEVVEADDRMAVAKKSVAEVRAEEAGGARYQNSHATAGRPMEWYVKPIRCMRSSAYRLRPSMITGRLSASLIRPKSGWRYSFQSVTTTSASAPVSAS